MGDSRRDREERPAADRRESGTRWRVAGVPLASVEPVVTAMLDACPEPAVVIDEPRRIVLANDKVPALVDRARADVTGLRLGDLLQCAHAEDGPDGCGTTPFCTVCGAAHAIAESQAGRASVHDYRVTRSAEAASAALDLRVWTTPLTLGPEPLTVVAIRDMTDSNRRAVLERVFFHDLLNAAGALRGFMQMWPLLTPDQTAEASQAAARLSHQIVEEIETQRDLSAAESGELDVRVKVIEPRAFLDDLRVLYAHHRAACDRTIALAHCDDHVRLRTDRVLLARVIGNLVKNALEASGPGQTVTLGFHRAPLPTFTVHNEGVIAEDVRLQIFQRAFTTKGERGRGLGTYSVKLLGERYLGGTVAFSSSAAAGTTFTVRLPASAVASASGPA